jgi:DNA-binding transcriptional LysR family regulator
MYMNYSTKLMELRHLRYFLAVAEELSFRRAAARLQIAQPPLSRQIRDLELEIGVRLFERNQRNVLLTKAGKSFLQDVKILLQQVDRAVETAQKIHRNQEGKLTIGFNRAASYQVLPQLLSLLAESFGQELQIQSIEMDNDSLVAALRQQQIDVAIGYLPTSFGAVLALPPSPASNEPVVPTKIGNKPSSSAGIKMPGTIWVTIQHDRLLLAFPNNSSDAQDLEESPLTDLKSLSGRILILPPQLWDRKDGERQEFLDLLRSQEIEPQDVLEVVDRETALSFVSNNLGVTIIPSSMNYLGRKGVIYKELSGDWKEMEILAIWSASNRSRALGSFVAALENLLLGN